MILFGIKYFQKRRCRITSEIHAHLIYLVITSYSIHYTKLYDKWDKEIVKNILANFRVSSKNGFYSKKGKLKQPEIESEGWEYLSGREEIRHIQPHYESWLWACYLWLYDKTGYQPLLDKAKAAIV